MTMRAHAIVLATISIACGNASPPPPGSAPTELPPATSGASAETIAAHVAALAGATGSSYDALTRGDAAALVAIGEPALPALVDCFENDARLSQITDDDGMMPGRLDVSTLCLRVIESILDEPNLAYREGATDRHLAATWLRAYLTRYGPMTPVERRVAMLGDEATSDGMAAIAARWLTSSGGPLDVPSALDYVGQRVHVGPMRGQSLRTTTVDLVGLMMPRAMRAMASGRGHDACEIAAAVVAWDASAEPRLSALGHACLDAACPCVYAFVARVAHDDPAAAARFLDQHGTTLLASDVFSRARGVEIAAALDVPEVRRIVEARLAALDVRAALDEAVRALPPPGLVVLLLAWSRAGLPSARAALDGALSDGRVLGTITSDPGADGARVRLASAEYTTHLPEPIGASQSLRAADLVANGLASELDVPFSLGWPEARRDAAIAELRRRL